MQTPRCSTWAAQASAAAQRVPMLRTGGVTRHCLGRAVGRDTCSIKNGQIRACECMQKLRRLQRDAFSHVVTSKATNNDAMMHRTNEELPVAFITCVCVPITVATSATTITTANINEQLPMHVPHITSYVRLYSCALNVQCNTSRFASIWPAKPRHTLTSHTRGRPHDCKTAHSNRSQQGSTKAGTGQEGCAPAEHAGKAT